MPSTFDSYADFIGRGPFKVHVTSGDDNLFALVNLEGFLNFMYLYDEDLRIDVHKALRRRKR